MDQKESKSNDDTENNNKNNSSGSTRNISETRLEHVGSLGTHNTIELKNNCTIPSNDEVLHNSGESALNMLEVSRISRSSASSEIPRKVKKKKKR